MESFGDRVLRAAVNVAHTRGQEGREWLRRAVLVAAGQLDHTKLDPGAPTDDPPVRGRPASAG